MKNQRFHQSDDAFLKNSECLIINAEFSKKITSDDKILILEFISELTGKISPSREYKLINSLILNREFFPSYNECKTSDVYAGIRKIINAKHPETGESRYKQNTITDRVKMAKRFFLWLCDNGYGDLNEKKLLKISIPKSDQMTKTAADILTEEDIHNMKLAALNSRDRAMISVLYEAGLRASELGSLTWNDVHFSAWNVSINTAGKTGVPRYIPLVESRSYLAQWMNDYPQKITPDSFVFITLTTKKPITYAATVKQIRKLAIAAGIDKHVTPHIFRHSRITHLIQRKVPETHIKKMMWGNITTDMFRTYAHIVNSDIDNCIADLNGIRVPEIEEENKKKKKILEPRQCTECGEINGSTLNYCGVCGAPLTDDAKTSVHRAKEELQKLLEEPSLLLETIEHVKILRGDMG